MADDLISLVSRARVFDLELPRHPKMPIHPAHRPGYQYSLHRRHADNYAPERDGPRTSASGILVMMEHTGTHIDAHSHQADSLTLCGGIRVDHFIETSTGFTRGGVEEIPPIVCRGVLQILQPGAAWMRCRRASWSAPPSSTPVQPLSNVTHRKATCCWSGLETPATGVTRQSSSPAPAWRATHRSGPRNAA